MPGGPGDRDMADAAEIPYCGTPPVPDALWRSWNLDPVLIAALLAIAGAYGLGLSRQRAAEPPESWRRASFYAGWSVLALALFRPSMAEMMRAAAARPPGAAASFALFTGFLWLWHAPGPYVATFESTVT